MADGKRKIKPDHDPIRAILSNISSCIESALPNSCACNANTMGLAPRSRSDLVYRLVLAFAGRHLSAHAWVVRHQRHQAGARGLLWGMNTGSAAKPEWPLWVLLRWCIAAAAAHAWMLSAHPLLVTGSRSARPRSSGKER